MVYALMLAFLLASGGLLYEALYASTGYIVVTVVYLISGLILITLTSRFRIAELLRQVGWAVVVVGGAAASGYMVPDELNNLRGFVVRTPSSVSWVDAWDTLGVFVQLALIVGLAIAALRRLNSFLLDRERPYRPGSTARPAA